MLEVTVIDYGIGNLFSVQRSLEHCGATVTVSADPATILASSRLVLPGVGAFGNAMAALAERNLVEPIREVAASGKPLMGICLGMQLLLSESEEFGRTEGLNLIPGRVVAVPDHDIDGQPLKIPHIGWNALVPCTSEGWQHPLLKDNRAGDAMYFVHSFMAIPDDPASRLADCHYGGNAISAIIGRGNVFGCQFHPEKSGEAGLRLIKAFCAL